MHEISKKSTKGQKGIKENNRSGSATTLGVKYHSEQINKLIKSNQKTGYNVYLKLFSLFLQSLWSPEVDRESALQTWSRGAENQSPIELH